MNFSAQNASRKWAYGAFRRIEPAMVTVAAVALLLGMPAGPAMAAKASRPAPWADLFRDVSPGERGTPRQRRDTRRCRCRSRARPRPLQPSATSRTRSSRRLPRTGSPTEQAAPAPQPTPQPSACRLALTDDSRDCAQHSRHQGRRRLRGRGSGAAGGDRAAGQAAGFGEAGGDPALYHGVCAGRVDPQRYRAAGRAPRQHRLRSRQFRLVRVPRPQPRRRRQALRARPRQRARRSRLQVRRRHARSR